MKDNSPVPKCLAGKFENLSQFMKEQSKIPMFAQRIQSWRERGLLNDDFSLDWEGAGPWERQFCTMWDPGDTPIVSIIKHDSGPQIDIKTYNLLRRGLMYGYRGDRSGGQKQIFVPA